LDCLKTNGKKKGFRTIRNENLIKKLNILKPGMEYGKYACLCCIKKSYKERYNEETTFMNHDQNDNSSNYLIFCLKIRNQFSLILIDDLNEIIAYSSRSSSPQTMSLTDDDGDDVDVTDDDRVILNLARTDHSHKKCIICNKKPYDKKLTRIRDEAIVDAYIKRSILIPFGSRLCLSHLNTFGFLNETSLGRKSLTLSNIFKYKASVYRFINTV
jgi:hypothetical protein